MHDILVGLQRHDLSACMCHRNSISIRNPQAQMPRLQWQSVVLSMVITIRHTWTYVLQVPWFQAHVEDAGSDRRDRRSIVCFSDVQQLILCGPRRASHGVDLYMLPVHPFKSMYFGAFPKG